MNADSIVIDMFYPYPVKQVWAAITDPVALGAWLMPNDFEPKVGHRFTFQSVSADSRWNGTVYCEVVELAEHHRVSYTWRGEGTTLDTLVTFTLEAAEGGTQLRLVHSGFASGGAMGLSVRDMLASGWNSKIMRERLPAYLKAQSSINNGNKESSQ